MDLKQVLDSGSVVRYHATLIERKQSNDQHQWEVAVILQAIYPECSKELLFYAMTHDSGEIFTSDVAAPVKRKYPEIASRLHMLETEFCIGTLGLPKPDFSDKDMLAVKYADILSGIYFTSRRVEAGDKNAIPIRDNWLEYFGSLDYLNDLTQDALEALR